jgi:hypothetical protein
VLPLSGRWSSSSSLLDEAEAAEDAEGVRVGGDPRVAACKQENAVGVRLADRRELPEELFRGLGVAADELSQTGNANSLSDAR